jgi:hypothetical protein
MQLFVVIILLFLPLVQSWQGSSKVVRKMTSISAVRSDHSNVPPDHERRKLLLHIPISFLLLTTTSTAALAVSDESFFAPKFVQEYSDFKSNPEGWSYRDVSVGKGESAQVGDRVVFDWSGYTIGYFGRPFQAKGGPQGGAFDKDIDYARTVIGSGALVPGLEQAFVGMQPGGVRQVVLPFGPLSYPPNDLSHDRVGPKPSTFSGQRALNFVLENPRSK